MNFFLGGASFNDCAFTGIAFSRVTLELGATDSWHPDTKSAWVFANDGEAYYTSNGYGGSSGGPARSLVPLNGDFEVTFTLSWSGRGYCKFGVVPVGVDCAHPGDSWCTSSNEGDFRATASCHDSATVNWYTYHNGVAQTLSTSTTGSGGTFKVKRVGSTVTSYRGSTLVGSGDSQGTVPMNFFLGGAMNDCAITGIALS